MRFTNSEFHTYEARIAAMKGGAKPTEGVALAQEVKLPTASFSVRQTTDEEKINRTERAFLAHLRANPGEVGAWIGIQSVTLKLGDDCRYTPDFFCVGSSGAVAWEVKGFMRDDAAVKFKVAREQYPQFRFRMLRKTKGGWLELLQTGKDER
jgi:hypothetical protein